jgi:hypothetical protein
LVAEDRTFYRRVLPHLQPVAATLNAAALAFARDFALQVCGFTIVCVAWWRRRSGGAVGVWTLKIRDAHSSYCSPATRKATYLWIAPPLRGIDHGSRWSVAALHRRDRCARCHR